MASIKLSDTNFKIFIGNLKSWRSIFELPFFLLMISLQYVCSWILYFFIKKDNDKQKIVVGFSNIYYNGNPRAVFEEMIKNPNKYEVFWVAKNLRSIRDVKKMGGKAFLLYGLLGLPYFLRTDVWVLAHTGMGNIPFLPQKNYKIVMTWHGIGPKGIHHTQKEYDNCDAWCVPSKFSKKRHIELWNANPKKLYVTGFAEMDRLRQFLKKDKLVLTKAIGINGAKVVLYAPTFDVGLWPWKNEYEQFDKFCDYCKKNLLTLILRLHPYAKINRAKLNKIIKKYSNVYWLDMKNEPDTMKLLAVSDILITDWSSIYTNFFLTKRPIIYFEIKKDFYTKDRGEPEIPPDYRAGEIVQKSQDFYKILQNVIIQGNTYMGEQEKLLDIIHGSIDGNASNRIIKIIENLVNKFPN